MKLGLSNEGSPSLDFLDDALRLQTLHGDSDGHPAYSIALDQIVLGGDRVSRLKSILLDMFRKNIGQLNIKRLKVFII